MLLFVLLVWLCYLSAGVASGVTYSILCSGDGQCSQPGMRCYYDYEGCRVGVCGCMYGTREDGTCLVKREGDSCTSRDQCPPGLDCHGGRCTCTGELIDGALYCRKSYEILLGDECGEGQICLHKTEDHTKYVKRDAVCYHGYCTCRKGLKQDGSTCRRLQPSEKGCVTSVDCNGDSVCKNEYCRCPEGFRIITHEPKKCGRWNAITDLAEGQICDEFIEKHRFCASNLECVKCGEDTVFKCRKYKSIRPQSLSSSSRHLVKHQMVVSLLTWSLLHNLINHL